MGYTDIPTAGTRLEADVYAANITEARLGGQLIARAQRTTDVATNGAEVGVLRLDDVPVTQGVAYQIYTSTLNMSPSVAGLTAAATLRITEDGSTPTSASTEVNYAFLEGVASFVPRSSTILLVDYYPASDLLLSVYFGWVLTGGVGTVTLTAGADHPVSLFIEAKGFDPGDTGTVL